MRSYRFILLFLLFSPIYFPEAMGQVNEKKDISGEVRTEEGTPVAFANVIALSLPDSAYITGVATDESGHFSLKSIPGYSVLSISCVGYKNVFIPCSEYVSVTLFEDETILREVEVVSSFSHRKNTGALVVNFQGNPIAKGKSTLEALRLVQGVEVLDDRILVNGKEGTLIYLGDRKITTQQLQSIPTSMIKSVEVIYNPGVSFGKDATGGVIRITLREKEGLLGSLAFSGQADREGFVDVLANPFVLYRRGKFSIYNSLHIGYGTYRSYYERSDKTNETRLVNHSITDRPTDYGIMENFGVRYDFTRGQSLEVYGGIYYDRKKTDYTDTADGCPVLSVFTKSKTLNLNAGTLYKAGLNVGRDSYVSIKSEYARMTPLSDAQYTLGQTDNNLLSDKMDYVTVEPRVSLSFENNGSFDAGFFYSYLKDDNRMSGIPNPSLRELKEQSYVLTGGDYAPWAEFATPLFGQKVYLQLGLRYQYTRSNYRDRIAPDTDYKVINSGLYPSANVQILLNAKKMTFLELVYKRSFSLPNYGYYSPIPVYQTEHLYSIGNQRLRQEIFHTVEAIYHFNSQWMIGYRLKTGADLIEILSHRDPVHQDVIFTRPENAGSLIQHQTSLSYLGSPTKIWHSNNRFFFNRQKETMPLRSVVSNSFGFSSTQQLSLKDNIGLTLSLSGESAQKKLAYDTNFRYALDIGGYISLLNNRLVVNLGLNNLLHSRDVIRIRSDYADLVRTNVSPFMRIKLTITWNFNSGDKIEKQRPSMIQSPESKAPVL